MDAWTVVLTVGAGFCGLFVLAVAVFFMLYALCSLERRFINRSLRRAFERQQAEYRAAVRQEWDIDEDLEGIDWSVPQPYHPGLR